MPIQKRSASQKNRKGMMMLFSLSLAENCTVLSSLTSRISVSSCVEVVDSFLYRTVAQHGGAINLNMPTGLTVTRSTFLETKADTGATGYGGAIADGGSSLLVSFSCFEETVSKSHGSAISSNQQYMGKVLNDTVLQSCGDSSIGCQGTLYYQYGMLILHSRLNFSSCVQSHSGTGVAFNADAYVGWRGGNWTISYCNIVNCSGGSGIDSTITTSVPGFADHCNFYDNSLSSSAVLICHDSGAHLEFCIFKGNSNDVAADAGGFVIVINCVFSEELPFFSFLSLISGSMVNSITASWICSFVSPYDCRVPSPAQSPTPTRSCTQISGLYTSHIYVSSCVEAIDSLFYRTFAEHGGAIDLNQSFSVKVTRCH
jgi:hypothetical protein